MFQFTLFANSIEASLNNQVENLELGMRNLGDTITSSSDTNAQFPFVTVDKFEIHGEHARDRTKVEAITYAPLVNKTLKDEWESWSILNQNWIEESRASFISHNEDDTDPVYLDGDISPYIYSRRDGIFAEPSGSDPLLPIWYLSPPPFNAAIVNYDISSQPEYRAVLHQATQSHRGAFSPVTNVEPFTSLQISDSDHLNYHEKLTNIEEGVGYGQPHSLFAQPVFETTQKKKVVGVLMAAIAWDAYFANLLPNGVYGHGVVCVLRSICGGQEKSFTYTLNGVVVSLLNCTFIAINASCICQADHSQYNAKHRILSSQHSSVKETTMISPSMEWVDAFLSLNPRMGRRKTKTRKQSVITRYTSILP